MINKDIFMKAMHLINTEVARQDELWDKLEDSYINVDKLIQEVNATPMIEMLAMICKCPFNTIADCVCGEYDDKLAEKLYDFLCNSETAYE